MSLATGERTQHQQDQDIRCCCNKVDVFIIRSYKTNRWRTYVCINVRQVRVIKLRANRAKVTSQLSCNFTSKLFLDIFGELEGRWCWSCHRSTGKSMLEDQSRKSRECGCCCWLHLCGIKQVDLVLSVAESWLCKWPQILNNGRFRSNSDGMGA